MGNRLGWWARRRATKEATKMVAAAIAKKVQQCTYDHKRDCPDIVVEVAHEIERAFSISFEEASDICLKATFGV